MKINIIWPHPDYWQGLCVGLAYGLLFGFLGWGAF